MEIKPLPKVTSKLAPEKHPNNLKSDFFVTVFPRPLWGYRQYYLGVGVGLGVGGWGGGGGGTLWGVDLYHTLIQIEDL